MSRPLISHSEDLLALVREGYTVRLVAGHLVIDDVPFLLDPQNVGTGRMVTPLNVSAGMVLAPNSHIMFWSGPEPVDQTGQRLSGYHSKLDRTLADNLTVNHQYSIKLVDEHGQKRDYRSYSEMVATYARAIGHPATAVDPNAAPKLGKPLQAEEGDDSPFAYPDTSSIRAGIVNATRRFANQTVAIVGLGGTGGYILDLVAKTRVRAILLFDDDVLLQHNAFRSPGAVPFAVLEDRALKVNYYQCVYSSIHTKIAAFGHRVTAENVTALDEADFVFVAIDHGPSKRDIFSHLDLRGTPYIDVGLGVELLEDDSLAGQVRTTLASQQRRDHIPATVSFAGPAEENEYAANIQVSDLNALNAALAVVRWKRFLGFYRSTASDHHSTFRLRDAAHVRSIFEDDPE